jgi:hypothetical protein
MLWARIFGLDTGFIPSLSRPLESVAGFKVGSVGLIDGPWGFVIDSGRIFTKSLAFGFMGSLLMETLSGLKFDGSWLFKIAKETR